jgi:ferredoxin
MSITRKEFFRQGFMSLGKTALDLADTLKGGKLAEVSAAEEPSPPSEPRPDMAAEPFNERCLARSCGCFACAEKCEPQAIMVVPGVGIRVDEALCTGCGTCEYVCPVQPKAVVLVPRGHKS